MRAVRALPARTWALLGRRLFRRLHGVDDGDVDLGQTAEVLRERAATTVAVSDEVRQLQLALKAAGFDPGPIDGIWGPRTQAALQAYQAARGGALPTARPVPVPTTTAATLGLPGTTWWVVGGLGALVVVVVLLAPGLTAPAPTSRARRRRQPARRRRR